MDGLELISNLALIFVDASLLPHVAQPGGNRGLLVGAGGGVELFHLLAQLYHYIDAALQGLLYLRLQLAGEETVFLQPLLELLDLLLEQLELIHQTPYGLVGRLKLVPEGVERKYYRANLAS